MTCRRSALLLPAEAGPCLRLLLSPLLSVVSAWDENCHNCPSSVGDGCPFQCGNAVRERTVVVDLLLPKMLASASLSGGVVLVSLSRPATGSGRRDPSPAFCRAAPGAA
jgi:hypothetical protein